jgi:transcriptional regulator with XRE-family HTH domain
VTDAGSPPWLKHLRAEVRARVRARNGTQASLAAAIGITPKHLSQVLTGKVAGSPQLLDRIAGAVGLRIVIMATGRDPVPLTPDQRGRWSRSRQTGAP